MKKLVSYSSNQLSRISLPAFDCKGFSALDDKRENALLVPASPSSFSLLPSFRCTMPKYTLFFNRNTNGVLPPPPEPNQVVMGIAHVPSTETVRTLLATKDLTTGRLLVYEVKNGHPVNPTRYRVAVERDDQRDGTWMTKA